ncbi:MAG TPA: hypothetical protein VGX78_00565 [Pirellulales bacterium]|jgi:hypothetical protein|nr:hypothetical protein [Pirellulales bacterium]
MKRTTITTWTAVLVCCVAAATAGTQRGKIKKPHGSTETSRAEGDAEGAEDGGLPSDKRLLAIYREFIVETLKVAKDYEKNKDIDGARTCYEQILKLVPNHPATKEALAKIKDKELSAEVKRFNVNANERWQDSGVDVIEGKPISIHAEGTWTFKMAQQLTAKGMEIPEELADINLGSLVGIIIKPGTDPKAAKRFYIGDEASFTAEQSGRLYLQMHDSDPTDNSGRLNVVIKGTFERGGK